MNHEALSEEHDEDLLIDRLVDGELPDSQRRALLERLDAVPGGWRRCALAFLEAQCWGEGLRMLAHRPRPDTPDQPLAPASRQRRIVRILGGGAALAASLLVAFQLGKAPPLAVPPAESAAVAPAQVAKIEPPRSHHMPGELVTLVGDRVPQLGQRPEVEGSVIDPWRQARPANALAAPWTIGPTIPIRNVGLGNGP